LDRLTARPNSGHGLGALPAILAKLSHQDNLINLQMALQSPCRLCDAGRTSAPNQPKQRDRHYICDDED